MVPPPAVPTIGRPRRSLVRLLVDLEIGVWRSLALFVTRRRPGQGPGAAAFPYAKEVTPILLAFVFVSVLELPVFHLLVPWEAVRTGLLVLGVWGLLWMLGYAAGMRVFPHVVDDRGLRLRRGPTVDVLVPWAAIADVRAERDRVATDRLQVVGAPGERVAMLPMLKQTRVRVDLREPVTAHGPDGPEAVVVVKLYADDAPGLVAACRARLAERVPDAPAVGAAR
jgi:hypothetical protein